MCPSSTNLSSGDASNPLSEHSFNEELRSLRDRFDQASASGKTIELSPREIELIQKRFNLSDVGLRSARAILRRSFGELRRSDDSPKDQK